MSYKSLYSSVFILYFMSFVYAYGDSNILDNPGFEKGREGWFSRTCAIKAVSSPVHSGNGSLKVTGRTQTWQGAKQSVFGRIAEGKTYKVSAWVKLDDASNDIVVISFEKQDDSGINYINVAGVTATDTGWVQLSGEFTLNVTGVLTVLDIYFEGPKPGVNFYVDDVQVYGPEAETPKSIPAKPNAAGQIDVNTRHQKIEGFGASTAFYTPDLVNHQKKNELYNLLFKDLSLDILRIYNYYDIEPQNFNETVEIIKSGQAALGRDMKIMISSWSPPVYLKSNANIIGGTLKKNNGRFVYDEFARWWYKSLVALKKEGIDVEYLNIQNEPDYPAPYISCVFAATEASDPTQAGYDKAFETVWQKLNTEMGPDMPKMLAPETSSLGHSERYIENLDSLTHVYGYAHHLYNCSFCGEFPDRFIPTMNRFNELVSQYGNKPKFQTEFEVEPVKWTGAISTALLIHNAMTVEQVTSYLYWDLFWNPDSGLISLNDPVSYTINPTYYTFKQYSAFIDSDWQRVDASTDNTGLRISAYISPDNRKLTTVIINTSADVDISLNFSIKGISISKGEIYRSSLNENCVLAGKYNGKELLKIPKSSVTTLLLYAKEK
jgi:glucuronoarabinoxylan endo-1,4-beta-xylanase